MKYEHPLTGLPVRRHYAVRKVNGSVLLFRFRRSAERWANRLASHNGVRYHVDELPRWPR